MGGREPDDLVVGLFEVDHTGDVFVRHFSLLGWICMESSVNILRTYVLVNRT
jgi:hypothetical protein